MGPNSPPHHANDKGLARPLNSVSQDRNDEQSDALSETSLALHSSSFPRDHSLAGSYRRPSFFTVGSRGTVVPHVLDQDTLTEWERNRALEEERELLADNHVIPRTSHSPIRQAPHRKCSGLLSRSLKADGAITSQTGDDEALTEPVPSWQDGRTLTETTPLLPSTGWPGEPDNDADAIDKTWEEAVIAGLIRTTWQRETKVLGKYSAPLMITFLLQYSLTVASIFTIGHRGKVELGAVSLASMTANITRYAIYMGLATSLDTLCAQAFGSGRKDLVGLQMQRMVYFLWVITIPIGFLWYFADRILMRIVPEKDVANLAGQYLKVVLLGAPGYACFESGKRYAQAQGLFSAGLWVLIICAPLNALMNWMFVWVWFPHIYPWYVVMLLTSLETWIRFYRCTFGRCHK